MKTYEQFLEFIKKLGIETTIYPRCSHRTREQEKGPWLEVSWETGGKSGGGWWEGAEAKPYTSNESPQELDGLDILLENVCPNLSFLQYKNLVRSVVVSDTWDDQDYYGNSTDYCTKRCNLRNLYDELVKRGFMT